ncbi:hypothetical protein Q4519_21535 [Motilimonas sp. 1_MG-2023]|uniref:hypothetical protein n=1 Tax=Motilimonas sp. 1_MG-2023 TaxID=3062672 RepID=UPI0026E1D749|nr:hypothetical protein [Motilimonas sp. 1_MG-2023]MDO6528241.1 hypothetical protein [Motilimonas sp. 1_MG-2023]
MKTLVFIVSLVLLQTGCSIVPQSEAIQVAFERGEYEGVNKDSGFYVTVPAAHSGPYSSVDLFNFQSGDEKFKDKEMSAVLGKSRKTGEWEVLIILTKVDGAWVALPKNK